MTPFTTIFLVLSGWAIEETSSIITGIPHYLRIRPDTNIIAPLQKHRRVISNKQTLLLDTASSLSPADTADTAAAAENTQESTPFHPLCILGICGPIGSGKSYACSLLVSQLNCTHHIDADSLAHSLYDASKYSNNRHLIEEIRNAFGPQVIHETDGTVNRQALGSVVFGDSSAMTRLELIVWPHLKQRLMERLCEIQKKYQQPPHTFTSTTSLQKALVDSIDTSSSSAPRPIVVVEAAVLIDTHWDDDGLFDAIWAIEASIDTSTQRLIHKRGMKPTDALQRLAAQQRRRGIGNLIDELKKGVVTAKIINDVDCQDLNRNNHTVGDSNRTETESNILLERLKRALIDPASWKPGRYPLI